MKGWQTLLSKFIDGNVEIRGLLTTTVPQTAPATLEYLTYGFAQTAFPGTANYTASLAITKGNLLYAIGYDTTNNQVQVGLADSSSLNNMPCIGMAMANYASGSIAVKMQSLGLVSGIDTSAYGVGTLIYVGSNGAFTGIRPNLNAEPVGVVVQSLVLGSVYIDVSFQYANSFNRRMFSLLNTDVSNTGSTTENVMTSYTITIPANTMGINDVFEYNTEVFRAVSGTGTTSIRTYFNTTINNITSGQKQVGLLTLTSGQLSAGFSRKIVNKNSLSTNYCNANSASAVDGNVASTVARSVSNIDFSQTQYLMFSIQNSVAGDTSGIANAQSYVNRP